jgi:hypothetical protein
MRLKYGRNMQARRASTLVRDRNPRTQREVCGPPSEGILFILCSLYHAHLSSINRKWVRFEISTPLIVGPKKSTILRDFAKV